MEHRRAARHNLDRPGFGVTRTGHELLTVFRRSPGGRQPGVHPRGRRGDRRADRVGKVETLARFPRGSRCVS